MTPTIGLALGGGGARGIAHIVLLEALDELGLRPTAIAGTSMGAVIGAAYAAGHSGRDIRAHALRVLRNRRLVLGRMLEARVGRFADLLARRLVNPVLVDAETLLELFCADLFPAEFEMLAVPLAVVAADFNAREEVVLRSGPLRSAIAASMAIPGLVRPVTREGRLLVDGGAVNPLPYEPLLGSATLIVACDVSPGRSDEPGPVPQPLELMLGASQIMQAALTGRMLAAHPPDLLVRPPVERFRLLDFFIAGRILEAADRGKEMMKRKIASRMNFGEPALATMSQSICSRIPS